MQAMKMVKMVKMVNVRDTQPNLVDDTIQPCPTVSSSSLFT